MRSKRFKQDQKNPRNQTKKRKKKIKRKNYNKTKWKKKERKVCFLEQHYGNHSCHSNDHFLFFWLCSPLPPLLSLSFFSSRFLFLYCALASFNWTRFKPRLYWTFFVRNTWLRSQFWYSHNFCNARKKGCGYCWLNTEQVWVSGHSFHMPTKESPLS